MVVEKIQLGDRLIDAKIVIDSLFFNEALETQRSRQPLRAAMCVDTETDAIAGYRRNRIAIDNIHAIQNILDNAKNINCAYSRNVQVNGPERRVTANCKFGGKKI